MELLIIYLTPVVVALLYSLTSSIGFFRTLFMLAGAILFMVFGFKNPYVEFTPFSALWWRSAGIIWGGATIFYMYLFADFSWEPHYYEEYTFVDRLFGSPAIEVREDVEYHWFKWVLISAFLGLATFGLGTMLQDIIIKQKGYLICGFIGLLFLIIYILRIVTKIIHSRR